MSNSKAVSSHRRKLKEKAIAYKGGECIVCSYSKSRRALHFHHLDPLEKDIGIGSGNTVAWAKLKIELDKCVLLCSNCHCEVHDETLELDGHLYKSPSIAQGDKILEIKFPIVENKTSKVCICGQSKHHMSKTCAECYGKRRRKIDWPDINILVDMVEESSYKTVAQSLGVSDNAVRNRIKKYS